MTTITNALQVPGKARSRKDSHTIGSIPTLMALDEEDGNHSPSRMHNDDDDNDVDESETDTKNVMTTITTTTVTPNKTDMRKYSDSNLPAPTFSDMPAKQNKKTKSSRRSSLGLGLLMGSNKNDSNKNGGKRRSSIAAILGRRNSKVC